MHRPRPGIPERLLDFQPPDAFGRLVDYQKSRGLPPLMLKTLKLEIAAKNGGV